MKKAIRTTCVTSSAIIVLTLVAAGHAVGDPLQPEGGAAGLGAGPGQDFYELNAEFTTAQAVTPGQGQAIDIAGIQVGKVGAVSLEDGVAVVRMDIEPSTRS